MLRIVKVFLVCAELLEPIPIDRFALAIQLLLGKPSLPPSLVAVPEHEQEDYSAVSRTFRSREREKLSHRYRR